MSVTRPRRIVLWTVAGIALLSIVFLAWNGNALRFLVALEASHVLGHPVSVGQVNADFAGDLSIVATDVSIGAATASSPAGTISRVEARLDRAALWHGEIHLLTLRLEQPRLTIVRNGEGWNWSFPDHNKGPVIDDIAIAGGSIHVIDAARKTDLVITQAESKPNTGGGRTIVAGVAGTLTAQPIQGHLVGGSLEALRDVSRPYPIDLDLHSGVANVTAKGTVTNPFQPSAARVAVDLRGVDLAALSPFLPVSLASSKPYHVAATLAYADGVLRADALTGTIGASDVAGVVTTDLRNARPHVTADLVSRRATLDDLVRFVGFASLAGNDRRVISDAPIYRSGAAKTDATIAYRAAQIATDSQPLQNGVARFTIEKGRVNVTELSAEAEGGRVVGTLTLDDAAPAPHLVTKLDFRGIDLKRFAAADSPLQETGRFTGAVRLDATGTSLAQMMGQGQGALTFTMSQGDLTMFIGRLPGVALADPVISALHLKTPTPIRCMAGDFRLEKGALASRVLIIETSLGTLLGSGGISIADEHIDYRIVPAPSRLPLGAMPGPMAIKGSLRRPVVTEMADATAPSGIATALGTVLGPIQALIGTVENSLTTDDACDDALKRAGTGQ